MKKTVTFILIAACLFSVGCQSGKEVSMDEQIIRHYSSEPFELIGSSAEQTRAVANGQTNDQADDQSGDQTTQQKPALVKPVILPPSIDDALKPNFNPFLYANAVEGMAREQEEKQLYGSAYNADDTDGEYFLYFENDFLYYTTFEAYAQDYSRSGNKLCFVSECTHAEESDCPAYVVNHNTSGNNYVNPTWVFDFHDGSKAPILYLYHVDYLNPDYGNSFIESYDLASGERETIYVGTSQKIGQVFQMYSYGDWLYLLTKDCRFYRLAKSGDEAIEQLQGVPYKGDMSYNDFNLLAVENDRLYYMLESFELYSVKTDLTDMKLEYDFDPEDMEDPDDSSKHPYCYVRDGYLYYMTNMSEEENEMLITCDLYRVPLNDLDAEPTLILSQIAYDGSFHNYAEDYLYFQRLEAKTTANPIHLDPSNGKLYILDLKTLKENLILRDTNFTILLRESKGDRVVFGGYKNKENGSLGNYSLVDHFTFYLSPDGTCIRTKEYLYTPYKSDPVYRDSVIYKFELE